MGHVASLGLLLGVATCKNGSRVPERLAVDAGTVTEALAELTGVPMVAGNSLDLIENGEVFDEIVKDIRAARKSVHVVTYIWRGEEGPSEQVGQALLARAAGVRCRIVIDPFGSLKFSESLQQRLTGSGCRIVRYDRGPGPSPMARTHRKIVVVDGERGITGGFGIWTSWQGHGRKPEEWRDTAVRVKGPVVAQMQKAFEQNWTESGGDALGAEEYPKLRRAGPTSAAFVASSPRTDAPTAARTMTHALIAAATKRLWIANSYFIPDEPLRELIIAKRKQGVDVRVLVPGPVHDVPPVRAAQRATYEPLLKAGVRIFEYTASMMHAKTMAIDGRFAVIGSTNIDALSFDQLQEGSLVADAPVVARKIEDHVEEDMQKWSKEITWEIWSKRDLLPDVAREAASLLSDWL